MNKIKTRWMILELSQQQLHSPVIKALFPDCLKRQSEDGAFLFCKAKHDRQLSGCYGIIQAKEPRAVIAMKMDRLIGILSILLQQERITAPELAEQFEVSRRTIQRDIEALCRAWPKRCTVW